MRIFLASPTEIEVHEISDALSKAMDVLHAAGMLNPRAITTIRYAERQGYDVVKFAHHLVSLASTVYRPMGWSR